MIDTSAYVLQQNRSPDKQHGALVDYVMERYSVAERFDRSFKGAAFRHWQLLRNILPNNWPYFSRWFEPESQNTVDSVVEGMMNAVFSKGCPFDLDAEDGQGDFEKEVSRETMLYYLERMKYKSNQYEHIQEGVTYGNGVAKHFIQVQPVTESRREPIFFDAFHRVPMGSRIVRATSLQTLPVMRTVSRFDCYPAPTGSWIQEMPYFIERVIVPLYKLQAMAKMFGWQNVDKLDGFMSIDQLEHQARGTFDERDWDLYARLEAVGYDVKNTGAEITGERVVKYAELLIYWEAPSSGDGGARMAVIGDRRWLLKAYRQNPFMHGLKQYNEFKFAGQDPHLWQSNGVIGMIEPLQMKLNVRSSQIGDIIERIKNPGIIYGPQAGVRDKTDLDAGYPGQITEVDGDPTQIRELILKDVPQSLWMDLKETRGSIQRAGGTLDYNDITTGKQQGQSEGAQTLGGIQLLMGAAQQAKSFKWRLAEEQGISEGFNIIFQNIQQMMTEPQTIHTRTANKVLSRAGFGRTIEVNPEMIGGRWRFYAVGASHAFDNQTQAQQIVNWALLCAKFAPDVAKRLKQTELAIEVGELQGGRNLDRFLMNDEELAEYQKTNPPPIPQKVRESMKYEKTPPDVQRRIEAANGVPPSQFGGSSPAEKIMAEHSASLAKESMKPPKQMTAFKE